MNQKEKLEEGGSQSVETKEKERQGRRWLIYFGAAKIWIRVRAPCLKLPTYKLSFIPSPPLSSLIFSTIVSPTSPSFSILHLSSRPYLLSLALSGQDPLLYTSATYIHWQGLGRDELRKKDRAPLRDNPFEIIYRIERRPTLLPLVSIIVSRRFIDAPRKRLLPESRLLAIRSLKAIPSRIRGERGGRKAVDRSAKFISEKFPS